MCLLHNEVELTCEELRMLRLPEIIWFMLGRAGIRGTLFISCLLKRRLYPLLMRCVVSAFRRLFKEIICQANSSLS